MVVTHQALRVVVFALMSLQKTCFSRKRSFLPILAGWVVCVCVWILLPLGFTEGGRPLRLPPPG